MNYKSMKDKKDMLIGFIGQGFIGKNYADDFAYRGYNIIRYDKDSYSANKYFIKDCDYVFIAVPTPTINEKFNDKILIDVMSLVGNGKVAIIKSTIKIGTTEKIQAMFPNVYVIHSPEFLTEVTADHDAKYPERNIVGYTKKSKKKCEEVLSIMANAKKNYIVPCKEAEMIKYAGNFWFYIKVVTINTIADLCLLNGIDYEVVKDGMKGDSRIGETHLDVLHKKGRGAGGHCFIKDTSCYKQMHKEHRGKSSKMITDFITAAEKYNNNLLLESGKDLDILSEVYNIKNMKKVVKDVSKLTKKKVISKKPTVIKPIPKKVAPKKRVAPKKEFSRESVKKLAVLKGKK